MCLCGVPAADESVQGALGIAVRKLDRSFVPSGTIISIVAFSSLNVTSTARLQQCLDVRRGQGGVIQRVVG